MMDSPVLVGSHVRRVAALGDDASAGPDGAVGVELLGAVGLVVVLALFAAQAGPGLGTDTDALALLGQGDFGADTDDTADDLCTRTRATSAEEPGGRERERKRSVYVRCRYESCLPWPTARGNFCSPQPPLMVWISDEQTPQASILISTSWSSKGFTSNSCLWKVV